MGTVKNGRSVGESIGTARLNLDTFRRNGTYKTYKTCRTYLPGRKAKLHRRPWRQKHGLKIESTKTEAADRVYQAKK